MRYESQHERFVTFVPARDAAHHFAAKIVLLMVAVLLIGCDKHEEGTTSVVSTVSRPPPSAVVPLPISLPASAAVRPEELPQPTVVKTPTAAERARILAGIAQLQAVVRRRASRGREADEVCDARTNAETPRIKMATQQIGEDRLRNKTRFSSRAPDLGATIEDFLYVCLGCTDLESEEAVPHECAQAAAALTDLADDLKAKK